MKLATTRNVGSVWPHMGAPAGVSEIDAALFALFSGLIFISAVTIIVAPWLHRLLHKFHLDDDDFKEGN